MSDVPAAEATEAPATTFDGLSKDEERVPFSRLEEEVEKRKELEKQIKALSSQNEELQDRDKSETERERAARERAEKQLAAVHSQLEEQSKRLEKQERGSWVAAAAAAARFADPQDAVALANLGDIESQKDAEKAVKRLADQKPHLVRQETPGQQIGQVLADGRPVVPGQEPDTDAEGEQFVADLKAALSGNKTSMPGLLDQ